jgi:hypothetical protein
MTCGKLRLAWSVSRVGTQPEKDQNGKWREIINGFAAGMEPITKTKENII